MSDNTMPERIHAGRIYDYVEAPSFASNWYEDEPMVGLTEYIRADIAQAQLDAANKRIIDLEHELAATRSNLLDRICTLLAEREWMPVSEGLPTMYATVYVVVKTPQGKSDIDFAFMTQAGWSYHLSPRNGIVTHWMPLPPPPVTDGQP